MHELPDEYLADAIALAKRIAIDQKLENYNIIQVCFVPFPPSRLLHPIPTHTIPRRTEQRKDGIPKRRPCPLSRHFQT